MLQLEPYQSMVVFGLLDSYFEYILKTVSKGMRNVTELPRTDKNYKIASKKLKLICSLGLQAAMRQCANF